MMKADGMNSKIYSISDWIMKLAYLNLLWIGFTLLGAVLFGIFPATVSMFTITRKWLMRDMDLPIFKTFWQTYRKEFLRTNLLGLILLIMGFVLYIDLKFFQNIAQPMLQPLSYLLIILLIVYFAVVLYIFPVYVHYDFKLLEHIKYSLIMAIGKFFQTIIMMISSFILYYIFFYVPGLIPFFGGSLFSLILMWIASKSFPQMDRP